MKSIRFPDKNLFLLNVFAKSLGKHQVQIQLFRSPITYLLLASLQQIQKTHGSNHLARPDISSTQRS